MIKDGHPDRENHMALNRQLLSRFVDRMIFLTDMTMPGMTGDKLAEKMLKIRSGMPIIIATGYNDAFNPGIAAFKGIMGYLDKPFVQRISSAK